MNKDVMFDYSCEKRKTVINLKIRKYYRWAPKNINCLNNRIKEPH